MSADNGIYILETDGPEYRVAHHQAIENVHWSDDKHDYSDNPDVWIENARRMWAKCEVYPDRSMALNEAARQLSETPICEYGISFIKIPRPFTPTDNTIHGCTIDFETRDHIVYRNPSDEIFIRTKQDGMELRIAGKDVIAWANVHLIPTSHNGLSSFRMIPKS